VRDRYFRRVGLLYRCWNEKKGVMWRKLFRSFFDPKDNTIENCEGYICAPHLTEKAEETEKIIEASTSASIPDEISIEEFEKL